MAETEKRRKVRVQLYSFENDDYNELWKVVGTKHKFYARHVFGVYKIWYYVCDPLGYCELNYPADDIDFVVCDQNGKKLFTSNNQMGQFPTLKETINKKYSQLTEESLHVDAAYDDALSEWRHWLLSFKDPNRYAKELEGYNNYDTNWVYCRSSYIKTEPIENGSFDYLGHKYQIAREIYEHDICHQQYAEICCTDDPVNLPDGYDYPRHYGTLSIEFDRNNYGPVEKHRPENRTVKD